MKITLKSVIIAILIIALIGMSILVLFQTDKSEDKDMSVAEFNDTISYVGGLHTKNYTAGDIITIRDRVYNVEVFEIPEIEINTTDYWEQFYSDFTKNTLLFTRVTFSDNETLIFSVNRMEQFVVGNNIKFKIPINSYNFVPNHIIKDVIDLAECHYNKFYLELYETIKWYAITVQYNFTLEIEELNDDVCLINITSFYYKPKRASPNLCDISISFWENEIKKDEFIGNGIGSNEGGHYIKFIFGEHGYWVGNKIQISYSKPGLQNYEFKIQLRYKYPIPGYENGRVIGNIQWEI